MSDEAITIEDPQARLRAEQVAFTREALSAPRRDANATIMVLLLVAFAFVTLQDSSIRQALVLIGVLLFHESGHLVGMRLFGFTDLRMFFLPGFGAAASGRKPGASAVEHAIVSLAGPLPGILIALPLLWLTSRGSLARSPMPLATEIVWMLALLNALNLAPLLPFDGGRFFEAVLFSRWPALDAAFRLVAVAGLGWIAMHGMPLLGIVAVGLLLSLRTHARVGYEAVQLRREFAITADPGALADDDLIALYRAADRSAPAGGGRNAAFASTIRQLHDRAARQPAAWLPTCGLMLVWLLGLLLAVAEVLHLVLPRR